MEGASAAQAFADLTIGRRHLFFSVEFSLNFRIPSLNVGAMKVTVTVMPKQSVLDPQGVAVRDAIRHQGVPQVRNVRIGKFLEIDIDGSADQTRERLHELCRDFLSNPVIEDYQLNIEN
jgi:phosphoribosylformylglycinamidine synthase